MGVYKFFEFTGLHLICIKCSVVTWSLSVSTFRDYLSYENFVELFFSIMYVYLFLTVV